jgi:hypothetical protein
LIICDPSPGFALVGKLALILMSSGRTIDYESLAQDAMRGVIRTVLARTAKSGLPGDHHFYISFDTQAPGVVLSKRLKDKYPEEMTIVLQHRFWDLAVTEDRFEVKLTFDGIPERLVVPFSALKVFFDPSVRYGLQFEAPDFGPDATAHPQAGRGDHASSQGPSPTPFRGARGSQDRKPRAPRKPRVEKPGDAPTSPIEAGDASRSQTNETRPPLPPPKPVVVLNPNSQKSGAEIVNLDAFRKK